MTVPKSKRTEGKLQVITKARDLRSYTIKVCTNEKNFPKRYRWCITNGIVQDTNELVKLISSANAIKVEDASDKLRRRTYQKMALELTEVLLDSVSVAYEIFRIEASRIEYWTAELMDIQRLLRAWMRSDKERYKDIG